MVTGYQHKHNSAHMHARAKTHRVNRIVRVKSNHKLTEYTISKPLHTWF